jgi:hypothetical protein
MDLSTHEFFKHSLNLLGELNTSSPQATEFMEMLLEVLNPYFIKREELEVINTRINELDGGKGGSQNYAQVTLKHSDDLSMKFNTVNRRIDEVTYEIDEFRSKLSSK